MSLVEFKDVTKAFGSLVVLKNIELSIKRGEIVFVVGPSGSGKSTLLRCINALENVTSGNLLVDGMDITDSNTNIQEVRREAGMVFQQFNLFPHMTAIENVSYGLKRARSISKKSANIEALALLNKVGLKDRANHYPNELSGGQKQRVAIARALAVKPELMLFDEPTSALDPELRYEVLKVMQELAAEGMTMIVVTHEMAFAREVGSRLIFMDDGKISEDGNPEKLMSEPPSERFSTFLSHIL